MKMEQIECSETSAYNNQTPRKYPKEYILDSKHGERLKKYIFVGRDTSYVKTNCALSI